MDSGRQLRHGPNLARRQVGLGAVYRLSLDGVELEECWIGAVAEQADDRLIAAIAARCREHLTSKKPVPDEVLVRRVVEVRGPITTRDVGLLVGITEFRAGVTCAWLARLGRIELVAHGLWDRVG